MTLGTWDPQLPSASDPLLLDKPLLSRLIALGSEDGLTQLETLLSDEDKQRFAALMTIEHAAWQSAGEPLTDAELICLIRFFAVAENLPGWTAGAKSPVIPLAKLLRQRGSRPDRSLLQWLREVNDNRYLPYGPL